MINLYLIYLYIINLNQSILIFLYNNKQVFSIYIKFFLKY